MTFLVCKTLVCLCRTVYGDEGFKLLTPVDIFVGLELKK